MWYGFGLVLWLQSWRFGAPDWLNAMVVQLSNMLYLEIPFAIALVLFWCVDRRLGGMAIFSLSFGFMFSLVSKDLLTLPRPWQLDAAIIPDADAVKSASGFSCPSGHVATAVSSYGLLAYLYQHKRVAVLGCVLLIVMTAFTRLYLGVHTPFDVFVGCFIGFLAVGAAVLLFRWMDQGEGRDHTIFFIGLTVVAVALIAVYLLPTGYLDGTVYTNYASNFKQVCKYGALSVGGIVGWYLERRYIGFDPTAPRKIRRFLLGAFSDVAVFAIIYLVAAVVGGTDLGFLMGGLAISLYGFAGYPWVVKRYHL